MERTQRYYAKVAGSRYVFQDGTEVTFAHGFADISEAKHQRELDDIIGKNPMIYLPEKLPEPLPRVEQNAVAEGEVAAADALLAGRNVRTAQEVGPIPADAGKPSDVNASTVDKNLQSEVMRAREQAAARAAQSVASVSGR